MKQTLKFLGSLLLLVLAIVFLGVAYLSIREYRPAAIEGIEPPRSEQVLDQENLSLMIYNIGYAGLDEQADFFMDGGKGVQPKDTQTVENNLTGIVETLQEHPADVYLLQEVDRYSKRSYKIDQEVFLKEALSLNSVFAYNFKVDYVPYPFPPIGRVESGLTTLTQLDISEAQRIALPVPFSWPVRAANLKRGLLETRLPIKDSEKELVLFNVHLEAYDSGEGKIAQSKKLAELLEAEYQKGNYVIAGGDFNQTFEDSHEFPKTEDVTWFPGAMLNADLPEHFSFVFDDTHPTTRLLNQPYTGDYATSQVYVIDGFILSDNLEVDQVQVIDKDFKYTDHQPVKLELTLKNK